MLVPPRKELGFDHLDAHAVADQFCRDLDRRQDVRQPEHVDRQPRRHEIVGAVTLPRSTWASRPITTRPCIEFGSHGPFETGIGDEGVAASGEEGLICHGAATMTE